MTTIDQFVIPAGQGASFTIPRGKVCRLTAIEGDQCMDVVFLNADDLRETFHAWYSYSFNCKLGTGNAFHCLTLFSGPPWERPMLTVVEDTVKRHFVPCGGRCSPMIFKLRDGVEQHASCQQNLADALALHGLGPHQVPDVFNIFMNARIDENGLIAIDRPLSKAGDHIDLRAEFDILCAVSACPDDLSSVNSHAPRPVGVEIYDLGPA